MAKKSPRVVMIDIIFGNSFIVFIKSTLSSCIKKRKKKQRGRKKEEGEREREIKSEKDRHCKE